MFFSHTDIGCDEQTETLRTLGHIQVFNPQRAGQCLGGLVFLLQREENRGAQLPDFRPLRGGFVSSRREQEPPDPPGHQREPAAPRRDRLRRPGRSGVNPVPPNLLPMDESRCGVRGH